MAKKQTDKVKKEQQVYKYNSLWLLPSDINQQNVHPEVWKSLTRFVDLFPGLIALMPEGKEEDNKIEKA